MDVAIWVWPVFLALIFALLAVDLLVVQRESHEVSMQEPLVWSIIWTIIGVGVAGVVVAGVGVAGVGVAGVGVAGVGVAGVGVGIGVQLGVLSPPETWSQLSAYQTYKASHTY